MKSLEKDNFISTVEKETRNIIDFFAYWKTEAIKAELDTKRHNFSIVCCNIQGDFNLSSCVRSANAFLAKEVIIYGKKNWDKRGDVGTRHYTNFKHVRTIDNLEELLKTEYKDSLIIGADNVPSALPIETYNWPKDKHIVLIFGEEQSGIPEDVQKLCNEMVYIVQYGSVRSLNVASAASITMFSLCSKLYG